MMTEYVTKTQAAIMLGYNASSSLRYLIRVDKRFPKPIKTVPARTENNLAKHAVLYLKSDILAYAKKSKFRAKKPSATRVKKEAETIRPTFDNRLAKSFICGAI